MPEAILGRTVPADYEPILRRFEDAWRRGERPSIDDHVPPAPANRQPLLVELIHLDLAYRCKAGEAARLEDYLSRYPELAGDRALLLDLMATEFQARRPTGSVAEYRQRYPEFADELTAALVNPSAPDTAAQADTHRGRVLSHAPPSAPVIPGYEFQAELGRGGMGVVYKARQTELDRDVALKMILHVEHAGPAELARFRTEAQAIARLRHPNIVQVYEIGLQEAGPHGALPYIALEFVSGGNLAKRLDGKPQPPRAAAAMIETLAKATHAAHQRGIVHRDLKPANVLIDVPDQENAAHSAGAAAELSAVRAFGGIAKITDFGLAKRLEADGGLTETGAVMGTPSYMAPEQARGDIKQIGPATDVYALGAILYEMLTGVPPFRGQSAWETLDQVKTQEPLPPSRKEPSVPRELETICLKCLHKEPERRYVTAEALADDLRRFLENEPILARPAGWQERAVKWSRRRPAAAALIATGLVMLLSASAFSLWYWDAHLRLKVAHYAQYAKRWGEPVGSGLLTDQQAAHRNRSFRFYSRGGRVVAMEVVNGRGVPTPRHDVLAFFDNLCPKLAANRRECRYEYVYENENQVKDEIAKDSAGNVVWLFRFDTPTTGHYQDATGFPRARAGSGATFVSISWSPEGFEEEVRYRDSQERPQPGKDGTYGQHRVFDALGQWTETSYLGPSGEPYRHSNGFGKITRAFDAAGNVSEEAFFDGDGKPMMCQKTRCARMVRTYDRWGNMEREAYYGLDGKLTTCQNGYAASATIFDDHGNQVEQSFWDVDGKPAYHQGWVRATMKYDDRGNQTEVAYDDARGRPTLHTDGFTRFFAKYNAHGQVTEQSYFGTDGQPTLHKDGNWQFTIAYDQRGNRLEERFFGIDGRPTSLKKLGIARFRTAYDDRDNIMEGSYFGVDDQPILSKEGVARFTSEYDRRGNMTVQAYFGLDGKPMLNNNGNARLEREYDERGNLKEERFLGLDGKLALNKKEGYARSTMTYDDRGHWRKKEYFGPDNKPILLADGYAQITADYDDRGNQIEEAYFGLDGKATLHKEGYARIKFEYDARGVQTASTYFGQDGRACLTTFGTGKMVIRCDERGNERERLYYDTAGRKTPRGGQYHRLKVNRDARGNASQESYFDVEDKPTAGPVGCAKLTTRYDARGNLREEAYFDGDGKPMVRAGFGAKLMQDFDARDNLIRSTTLDLDGTPALRNSGYATLVNRYDDRDQVIETAYFGGDGKKPVLTTDGYAKLTRKLDERGLVREEAYFGLSDEEVLNTNKVAKRTWEYDDRGNMRLAAFFGLGGRATLGSFGYASLIQRHDERDRLIEERSFGENNQPLLWPTTGAHRWTTRYDDRNNQVIERAYYGLDDKPKLGNESYAKVTYQLDEQGRVREEAYFGVKDEEVLSTAKVAKIVNEYDERGNVTQIAFFGLRGKPTLGNRGFDAVGCAKFVHRYDERNRMVELRTYGVDGLPMLWALNGAHRWTAHYDDRNNLIERTYYGLDGKTPARSGEGYEEDFAGLPVYVKSGYARTTRTFDAQGRLVDAAYFDERDQPLSVEVVVRSVAAGSLAEKAGLKPGDVVESYAGEKVVNAFRLTERRRLEQAGMPPSELTLRRENKPVKTPVPSGILGAVLMDRMASDTRGAPAAARSTNRRTNHLATAVPRARSS